MHTVNHEKRTPFSVYPWTVCPDSNEIRQGATVHRLEPKVMALLLCLAGHAGQVVSKEEIFHEVWPDVFVSEDVLARCVSDLRRALGDTARRPTFIETIPKRGYRFVAPVTELQETQTAPQSFTPRGRWMVVSAALTAVLVVGIAALLIGHQRIPKHSLPIVPSFLTTLRGQELSPSFSPDGKQLVFAWSGPENGLFDLYVKPVDGETIRRLTNAPSESVVPAWSPDGRWIAFVRNANSGGGIFLISPDGSNEQRLLPMPFDPEGRVLNVSWSADSKELAFVRDFSHGESGNVAVLTVATGAIRNVTERSPEYHEWSPVFSPDGSRIAFYRCFRADCHINVVAKHGGPITTLTREATVIGGTLAWTADGSAVLAVRNLPDGISIWRYRDAQHAPERLYATHDHVLHLALSPDGSKLAFDSVYISENIWRWDMTQPQSRPQRFISSSRGEEFPQVSPDGRKIAFHSIRSGTWEVWVTDADGTNSRQLTHTAEGNSLYPRWSPDSRALIHDVRSHGRSTLAMIQLDSGDERRIGTGSLNAETPAFSPDGAAISFAAIQDGQSQIFLLPRDGGTPRQLTHKGGYMPSFSADGKFVFYARSFGKGGIWRIPAAGGEEELVTDKLQDRCFADWVLDESGVFYQANAEPDRARIEHLDLRTGRVREVLKLDVVAPWSDGLSVTPDGHYLLFPRPEPTQSDIMWIPLPS